MVIHPDRWQIEDDRRAEVERQFRATQHIDCLDLTPDFRREGAAGGRDAFRDTHDDNAGNALAARRISEWIASRYDLPC